MLGARRARIRSYARFYEPFRNLVLTGTAAAPEDPPLRALEPLLQIGRVLLVETPQSMQPLSAESAYKRPTMPQMPVVSADPHADALAHQHGVEIVASSSVLCALFQTVGPDFHQTWQIPIVVKKHGGRAVAYLDKPLIRPKYDMREKNEFLHQEYGVRRNTFSSTPFWSAGVAFKGTFGRIVGLVLTVLRVSSKMSLLRTTRQSRKR